MMTTIHIHARPETVVTHRHYSGETTGGPYAVVALADPDSGADVCLFVQDAQSARRLRDAFAACAEALDVQDEQRTRTRGGDDGQAMVMMTNKEREAAVNELDALYEEYATLERRPSLGPHPANVRGFLVGLPGSKFYREPPHGAPQWAYTDREIRNALVSLRLDVNMARRMSQART